MPIQTQNPATGDIVKHFEPHSDAYVEKALEQSVLAFKAYASISFQARAEILRAVATILDAERDRLARLATLEMGKTFKAAQAEIAKCAKVCRFYAQDADKFLTDSPIELDGGGRAFRRYLPLGPILAIMPWNFPFWQVFRFAAPALMAGNSCLLKHASNVPQCALMIEDIFTRAGLPPHMFQTLLIPSHRVEPLLRDSRICGATLTGSETAGASVAAICGQEIKPSLLELGGSDPFIIMPSANLDKAVQTAITARTMNNGQSCIAAKRYIVHADIYAEVKARLKAGFEALRIGDPMDLETDIGPLVNAKSRDELQAQIDGAIRDGACRIIGAKPLAGTGFYFEPGILENVSPGSSLFQQEIFGPVALLFRISSIDEAIDLANQTPFGLGSAIFTQDPHEQTLAIDKIEAGATFINAMTSSDIRLPFGGIKRSGYGRELAAEGIRAFCNIKTVLIA